MNHDERIRVIADDISQTIPKLHRWMLRSDIEGNSPYSPMAAVLKVVKKQGPISMSAIADALYYSKQNLTKLVDKMVKEGYVERLPDPSDRRVSRVALTMQGRTFLAGRKENIKNRMVEDLSHISEEDLERLFETFEQVKHTLPILIGKANPQVVRSEIQY